jgi:hypothetical protein
MAELDLDELATHYKDGPVHKSIVAAKALEDELYRETDPVKQAELASDLGTWMSLIEHEIAQISRSDDDPDDYVKYLA